MPSSSENPPHTETKSERVGVAVTPTELRALEFIQQTHGERYEGASSVLRDYSLIDAVSFYQRAKQLAKS